MSGFQQIRLYQNTSATIPVGVYTDVTSQFISTADATNIVPDVSYDYDGCDLTVTGLTAGTQYYYWIELIDEAGNSSGVLPIGDITTAAPPAPPADYTAATPLVIPINGSESHTGILSASGGTFLSRAKSTLFYQINFVASYAQIHQAGSPVVLNGVNKGNQTVTPDNYYTAVFRTNLSTLYYDLFDSANNNIFSATEAVSLSAGANCPIAVNSGGGVIDLSDFKYFDEYVSDVSSILPAPI